MFYDDFQIIVSSDTGMTMAQNEKELRSFKVVGQGVLEWQPRDDSQELV